MIEYILAVPDPPKRLCRFCPECGKAVERDEKEML